MTANLKIKNDRFYAVINYKEGTEYKQKWIALGLPVKNNKRKAEAMLQEIRKNFEEKYSTPEESMLFTTYVKQWLVKKKPFIELSTWEGYQIYAERHIIPYFEPLKLTLKDIKSQHIKEYYDFKFTKGRLDGKPGGLSIPSIKKHSIVLKEVLADAYLHELIDKNPAAGVKLPSKETSTKDKVFLDIEKANTVIKMFDGHPLQAMICVTLYYGLRRSEALGLRWRSIDFEKGTLTIDHTVVKNLSIVEKDTTKTESSHHTYFLIDDVRKILTEVRKKQELNKKELGAAYVKTDYVFTWEDGTPFRPDYVTKAFQRVLKRNDFPLMRFHDLRHSTASILYDEGWELKDIQNWLRHSDISVTGDIYTHISKEREARMSAGLNSKLTLSI